MVSDSVLALTVAATAANGILTGASLDQSIKQLPARHRMGMVAFSAYSRAADLGPTTGVPWYVTIGIGSAALTFAAAGAAYLQGETLGHAWPLYIAAGLSVAHSLATAKAAPTNFSQRRVANDEEKLAVIFARFTRWQTLRAVLQTLTFLALLGELALYGAR